MYLRAASVPKGGIPEGSVADAGFALGLGPLKFPGKCITVEAASDPQRELRDEAGKVDGGYLRNICLLSDGLRIYLIDKQNLSHISQGATEGLRQGSYMADFTVDFSVVCRKDW